MNASKAREITNKAIITEIEKMIIYETNNGNSNCSYIRRCDQSGISDCVKEHFEKLGYTIVEIDNQKNSVVVIKW